jgi:hypothetical protein
MIRGRSSSAAWGGRGELDEGSGVSGGGEAGDPDYPDPVPGPDEVVIRMKATGMCGNDLHSAIELRDSTSFRSGAAVACASSAR